MRDLRDRVVNEVIVVADGVFSASREVLFGERYRARYTGQSAFRVRVALTTDAVSETWGPGRRFGITPYRDGTTNWYAAITTPSNDDGGLAELKALFDGWHDPIPAILARLDESATSCATTSTTCTRRYRPMCPDTPC